MRSLFLPSLALHPIKTHDTCGTRPRASTRAMQLGRVGVELDGGDGASLHFVLQRLPFAARWGLPDEFPQFYGGGLGLRVRGERRLGIGPGRAAPASAITQQ